MHRSSSLQVPTKGAELTPIPWTPAKGDRVMGFELHRAHVAERLMQPLPIIEHLDKLEHLRTGFLPRVVIPVMDQLILERTKEALDHGVVITVALAAHAGHEALLGQDLLIGPAGIECPLIRVMDQAGRWLPLGDGHLGARHGHLFVWRRTHGPADHAAGVQIEPHGQVQPARAGRDRREIPGPDPIRGGSREDLLHMVGGGRGELMMLHHQPESPRAPRLETVCPSQPRHAVPPTRDTARGQCPPELDGSIALFDLGMELADPLHQDPVRSGAPALRSSSPAVVAAAADAEDRAQTDQPVEGALRVNELVPHGDSRAKNAAAFFKMSRSSRSRAFSRRSRVSSSVLGARPPLPGNEASPWVSNSCCHLYRWLRRSPNSRATAAAGRPELFHSRIASSLNSLVNGCRFAIGHLLGAIVPFLRCPRKWGYLRFPFHPLSEVGTRQDAVSPCPTTICLCLQGPEPAQASGPVWAHPH